jgi:hypothetical protein
VVDGETMQSLYDVHIINKTRSTGTISMLDGTFRIAATVGDTLKFSFVGYKNKIMVVDSIHRIPSIMGNYIIMDFDPMHIELFTVYGKTYEQFKRDFVKLQIVPKTANESYLESIRSDLELLGRPKTGAGPTISGPIQMLYDQLNKKNQLRRKISRNREKYGNPDDYIGLPATPDSLENR